MIELVASEKNDFLSRFHNFYDALVRSVYVSFNATDGTKHVTVVLSSQDQTTDQDDGWANITINVDDVKDIILIETKSTCAVLSSGLNIEIFDGIIYLDFCPYTEEPNGIEDFLKSSFLVAGKRCIWTVTPYREDPR